jgi:hypothetical protein
VELLWLNGGAYDSVRVYRDAGLVATLDGGAGTYTDAVDRGPHDYAVSGLSGGVETAQATASVFAGLLDCHWDEDLETSADAFDLEGSWNRTSTLAAAGAWSLTDSPAGSYLANRNTAATQTVPVELVAYPTLSFDHICITEDGYDFGIVEISADFGKSWDELARYDEGAHAEWADHSADPGDWVHEALDLNAYVGMKVIIRFRVVTDGFVQEDGWYVDDIQLSTGACETVTGITGPGPEPAALLAVTGANPFRTRLRLAVNAEPGTRASVQVFDAQGRLVRTVFQGLVSTAKSTVTWDGRDETGRPAAAGFYLVRAATPRRTAVARIVKLH